MVAGCLYGSARRPSTTLHSRRRHSQGRREASKTRRVASRRVCRHAQISITGTDLMPCLPHACSTFHAFLVPTTTSQCHLRLRLFPRTPKSSKSTLTTRLALSTPGLWLKSSGKRRSWSVRSCLRMKWIHQPASTDHPRLSLAYSASFLTAPTSILHLDRTLLLCSTLRLSLACRLSPASLLSPTRRLTPARHVHTSTDHNFHTAPTLSRHLMRIPSHKARGRGSVARIGARSTLR